MMPNNSFSTPKAATNRRKKGTQFRKTIALVSLYDASNKPSSSKSNSLLEYQVITQLVVTIDSDNCSLTTVSNLVQQQIGFEVILLDSKCFPVMESDTTNSIEFWKSNRRILAASKELYDKLKGTSADPIFAKQSIDVTGNKRDWAETKTL